MDRRAYFAFLALITSVALLLPGCRTITPLRTLPTVAAVAQPFPTPLVATSAMPVEMPAEGTADATGEGWDRGTAPAMSLPASATSVATTAVATTAVATTVVATTSPPTQSPPTVMTPASPTSSPVPACRPRDEWPVYRVQRGDTLAWVARASGSTLIELMAANCLTDPNRIEAGSLLYVPRPPVTPTATTAPTPTVSPTPAGTIRYLSPTTGVQIDYPAHWSPNGSEPFMGFGAADGFVEVGLLSSPADIDLQASQEAWGSANLYGSAPAIQQVTVAGGVPARLIRPSADQRPELRDQHALIAYLPQPVRYSETLFNYVLLSADGAHLPALMASLQLSPPTPMVLHTFAATAVPLANGGRQVTLFWDAEGVTRGQISAGTSERHFPWWEVLPAGTMTVELNDTEFPNPRLSLSLWNDANGQHFTEVITIDFPCRHSYFFSPAPERCPAIEPLRTTGAHQSFERGFMIWLPQPTGLSYILVFTNDGRLRILRDDWTPGMPEADPSIVPPAGLVQPVRGFGKVWREDPQVRDAIGWALADETAYNLTYQGESRSVMPSVAYVTGPDGTIYRTQDITWSVANR